MGICEGCHAGCCRSFAVPITGADVLRIERSTGRGFWDFACRWADPDGTIARRYAPHFHFADDPQTPYVLCLAHTDSAVFPTTSKCVFLEESAPDAEHPLGQGRCGVYDDRPAACRVFPTRLDDAGELAVLYDVPERGREGDDPLYDLCPREWTPADVDALEAVPELVLARYEMDFFRRIAELWNRRPQEWLLFPEFLRVVYARRVVTNADVEAAEEPQTLPLPIAREDEQGPRREAA